MIVNRLNGDITCTFHMLSKLVVVMALAKNGTGNIASEVSRDILVHIPGSLCVTKFSNEVKHVAIETFGW
jgi:hypothetical protein